MELEIGSIMQGKVTGITKFGAFVSLPNGSSGLVHISEIANAYVNDVHDYLTDGQSVSVKVLSVNEAGKINLSIKQALPPSPAGTRPAPSPRTPSFAGRGGAYRAPAAPAPRPEPPAAPTREVLDSAAQGVVHGPSGDASFEDKLKHFMQDADSRMSGNKLYADRKGAGRRRK